MLRELKFRNCIQLTSMLVAQQKTNLIGKVVSFGNEIGMITDIIKPSNYYPKVTNDEYDEGEYLVLMFDNDGDLVQKIKSAPSEITFDLLDKAKQFIQVVEHYFGYHFNKCSILLNYPKN